MPRVIDSDSDEFSSDAEMDDVDIEAIEAAEAEYANNGKRKLTAADKGKGKEAAKKGKGADVSAIEPVLNAGRDSFVIVEGDVGWWREEGRGGGRKGD